MKDRLKQLMEAQHMNQQSFAGSIGISNATLSSIFTGRTNPTNKIVEAIHNTFPNVRTDWLMWGTGPMFDMNEASSTPPSSDLSEPLMGDLFGSAKMSAEQNRPLSAASGTSAAFQAQQQRPSSPGYQNPASSGHPLVSPIITSQRKITEIRVFYDDQTWESFTPKK